MARVGVLTSEIRSTVLHLFLTRLLSGLPRPCGKQVSSGGKRLVPTRPHAGVSRARTHERRVAPHIAKKTQFFENDCRITGNRGFGVFSARQEMAEEGHEHGRHVRD